MPARPLKVQSVPYSERVDRDQDEPRWLGPEELAAWMSYVAATTLLDSALDRQLQREAGMPLAYYQILAMLADVPERTLRMSDLAAITQSSQSRLSHAVRLERRGWICAGPARGPAAAPVHVSETGTRAGGRRPGSRVACASTVRQAVLQSCGTAGHLPDRASGMAWSPDSRRGCRHRPIPSS